MTRTRTRRRSQLVVDVPDDVETVILELADGTTEEIDLTVDRDDDDDDDLRTDR
jgi:hypothetical protein